MGVNDPLPVPGQYSDTTADSADFADFEPYSGPMQSAWRGEGPSGGVRAEAYGTREAGQDETPGDATTEQAP